MWRTVLITVVCVAVEFVLGFGLALLLAQGVPRARPRDGLLPAADDGRPGRLGLHLLHALPARRADQRGARRSSPRRRHDRAGCQDSDARDLGGDDRRHLAVDAAHVPDLPLGARRPARGSDERRAHPRRRLLPPAALPDPPDDEADHPDRADHPRDRGLQALRPDLPAHPGRPGRGDDEHLDLPLSARRPSNAPLGLRERGRDPRPDLRQRRRLLRRSGRSSGRRRRRSRSSSAASARRCASRAIEEAIEAEARV